jgi:hypothetical protein
VRIVNDITVEEERLRLISTDCEQLASFFLPETKPEYSATENRVIEELCCARVEGDPSKDAKAQQLDELLKAAAARGEKVNLDVRSTSGM